MLTAEELRRLTAAGINAEQLVLVAELVEERQAKIDEAKEKSRDRKRKQREASRDSHGTVTGQSQDSHGTPPPNGSDGFPHPSLPSLTPPKKTPLIGGQKKVPQYSESFERFWADYPRERRGNKQEAFRAWKKAITRSEETEIFDGLAAYLGSDHIGSGYEKGCTAWLNDDRWKWRYNSPQTKPVRKTPIAIGVQF